MSAWIQVAGYADDLQVAYDHHKLGGPIASQRFWERYQRTIDSIIVYPESVALRPHGWRQKPIPRSVYSIFYGQRGPYWMLVGIQSTIQDPDRIQAMLLIREVASGY
jgi:plasmid stabilization system protein ParE